MGEIKRCRPRDVELTALQFTLGETTKRQIVDFCPDANVGTVWTLEDQVGLDSTDLRWVMVPVPDPDDAGCRAYAPCHDTSWILRGVTGEFFVVPDWRYQETYEEIT